MKKRIFEKENPGKFEIKTRFWDPEKEEREEREKRIKAELGIEDKDDVYVPNIEGKFRQMLYERKEARMAASGKKMVRRFMVLILLFFAIIFLLTKYADEILGTFI